MRLIVVIILIYFIVRLSFVMKIKLNLLLKWFDDIYWKNIGYYINNILKLKGMKSVTTESDEWNYYYNYVKRYRLAYSY